MQKLNETDYNAFKERMLERMRLILPSELQARIAPNLKVNDPYQETVIVDFADENARQGFNGACIQVSKILGVAQVVGEQEAFDSATKQLFNLRMRAMKAEDPDVQKLTAQAEKLRQNPFQGNPVAAQLINAEENAKLLEKVPHRKVLDLALIYRILLEAAPDHTNSVVINTENMKEYGLNEEQLHQKACDYMKGLKTRFIPIDDETFERSVDGAGKKEIFENHSHAMNTDMTPEQVQAINEGIDRHMYLVHTDDIAFGAAIICEPHFLDKICGLFGWGKIGIVPDTMNDLILFDYENADLAFTSGMKETLEWTNEYSKDPDDILSGNIYAYDKTTGRLSIIQ